MPNHTADVIDLLKRLIATPSFSRKEDKTADLIADFLQQRNISVERQGNNVWAKNAHFAAAKPTILLNSHHDTVQPVQGWTKDPFTPTEEGGTLYGLGSNDAGASLMALLATFLHFYQREDLPYNLLYAATAEEEISGSNGIAAVKEQFGDIAVGIVGEPTQMHLAIAEKGLLVVDGVAHGKAGHAARNEGENAIYKALVDVQTIQNLQLEKVSDLLGSVKMTVTQIEAGTQHNVVPDQCRFVIDVRTNECYSNQAVFDILQQHCQSELAARSFRLNSSGIPLDHPLVQRGIALGRTAFGSPTLSDQALLDFPSLKMGPGDSARSHTADEYILLSEIEKGVELYIKLLEGVAL